MESIFSENPEKIIKCIEKTSMKLKIPIDHVEETVIYLRKIEIVEEEIKELLNVNKIANIRAIDGQGGAVSFGKKNTVYKCSILSKDTLDPSFLALVNEASLFIKEEKTKKEKYELPFVKMGKTKLLELIHRFLLLPNVSVAYTYMGAPISKSDNRLTVKDNIAKLHDYY